MPKYVFHKLVRDGLEQIYVDLEQKAAVRHLKGDELWRAMKAKFVEEALELPNDLHDTAAVTSELADLLRILKDAATEAGVAFTDVEKADEAKTSKKGGFRNGVFVDTLELKPSDPWNDYYRKEPARFPEISAQKAAVDPLVYLSEQLGELGNIDRATLLPGGRAETDSHHSFSLALIAYDICKQYCPELDADKVMRLALVHDLPEIITGDEDTLQANAETLAAKHDKDKRAVRQLKKRLADFPALLALLDEYERLDTPEAATVYVLDKCSTTWTHFWDFGSDIRRKMSKVHELDEHHNQQLKKIHARLKAEPPEVIYEIYELSHAKMKSELFKL